MKHSHSIQISIPQPCSEDRNKMTPQEQGRFCDSCQKCVVDFTGLTDEQLYKFLNERKEHRICGRLSSTQLNRQINIPYQPHSPLYKWMIAAGLTLVLNSTPDTQTFAKPPVFEFIQSDFIPTPEEKSRGKEDTLIVKGYVTDGNNEPVFSAQVSIRRGEKILAGTISDSNGYFEIKLSATDTADANIFVHYIGLREYMEPLSSKEDPMDIKLDPTDATFGLIEVIIVEHDPPLINEYESGHTKTIKSEEIEKGAY